MADSNRKVARADVTVRAPGAAVSQCDYIRRTVVAKRNWHYSLTEEKKGAGFKGWHTRGYLPHFDAPGLRQFITFRLHDSVPSEVRREWLQILELEDPREKFRRIEWTLDRGYGACHLKVPEIAQMIQQNLWFHHRRSYHLIAWVIMPNHIHVLAEMIRPLSVVVKGWKAYTARRANEVLGMAGNKFWQADYFDRYVRDQDELRRIARYIENNPVRARLARVPQDWVYSSARYRGRYGVDEPLRLAGVRSADGHVRDSELVGSERADVTVRAPNA